MGKGEIHYIEVATDSVDSEEEEEQDSGSTSLEESSAPAEEQPLYKPPTPVGAHPPVVPQPHEQVNRRNQQREES
jgi:hypothetical protein